MTAAYPTLLRMCLDHRARETRAPHSLPPSRAVSTGPMQTGSSEKRKGGSPGLRGGNVAPESWVIPPQPAGTDAAAAPSAGAAAATAAAETATSEMSAAAATASASVPHAAVAAFPCETATAAMPTAAAPSAVQRTLAAAKEEGYAAAAGSVGVVVSLSPPAPIAKRKCGGGWGDRGPVCHTSA
jgi:hypothetical protein